MRDIDLVKAGIKAVMNDFPELKEIYKTSWQWKNESDKMVLLEKSVDIFRRDDAESTEQLIERMVAAAGHCIMSDNKWNLCNLLQKARNEKACPPYIEDGRSVLDLMREAGVLGEESAEENSRKRKLEAEKMKAWREARSSNRKKEIARRVRDI